jgi:predicted glycosyltransferase
VRTPPVLVYCQHLLGLGHAQRTARLVRALAQAGEPVVVVTGGRPLPGLDWGGTEVIPLPPLTAADETAGTLIRPDGVAPDPAYLAARRDHLLALVAARDPAVVVLELFPFGRHPLAFELAPLLLALADDRVARGSAAPRVAVSVRDVLVSKPNRAWRDLAVLAACLAWVDRVLVHGSPDVIAFHRTFSLADRLGDRLVYTGYVAETTPEPAGSPGAPAEVVVSAGGGQVGERLFRTALAARALLPAAAARPWRLLSGPYLPAVVRNHLAAEAASLPPVDGRPALTVETFRPHLSHLLRGAALSLSQAGYNTVVDVLQSGVRAVVVPFEGSGDEQPLRAALLAERGLLIVVPEADLTPQRLATALDDALTRPGFPVGARLDLDGAARTVAILRELAAGVAGARAQAGRR